MAKKKQLTSSVEIVTLPRGSYNFSVRSSAPSLTGLGGNMVLPGLHVGLCPGQAPDGLTFDAEPGATGFWLCKATDIGRVQISVESAPILILSVQSDQTTPLEVEIERADSGAASGVLDDAALPELRTGLRTQITAHIQNRGDLTFLEEPWCGLVGEQLWIEAFEIVPREKIKPEHIEYKALDAAGTETPWIKGGWVCGSRGLGIPLIGFALRLNPESDVTGYDVEYTCRFISGHIAGPARNGEPVFSAQANDPIEAFHIAIIESDQVDAAPPKRKRPAAKSGTPKSA